jgi:hypothetical protein
MDRNGARGGGERKRTRHCKSLRPYFKARRSIVPTGLAAGYVAASTGDFQIS